MVIVIFQKFVVLKLYCQKHRRREATFVLNPILKGCAFARNGPSVWEPHTQELW